MSVCVCLSVCLAAKLYLTLLRPQWTVACQAPLSMDFPAGILQRVAISFSRGSFRPRDQTCISCVAGEFFTDPPGKPYAKDTNIQSKK